MTANATVLAYIRTYVPYLVGLVLAWLLLHTGIDLNGPFAVAAEAVIMAGAINVYYLIVRVAEVKIPGVGILLGAPSRPVYEDVSDLWNSFVRTGIPTVVSAVVVALGGSLLHLSPTSQTGLISILIGLVSAGYYALARLLESHYPSLKFLIADAPVTFTK